ncbi:hypothetical protein DPMN_168183 [Dreissena polymorpha]|uniref:Uncharacterized protein n=1 Tax=Dreissena polymorpha TaxID=45954 RepID=A0A9D4F549_DREPO|nr:hypothetical protein DPMN_168183 [Dreissena polymorpha]
MNILTKFHKDWMKTVTSTINILTKFHKDWMKTVTSTVYTNKLLTDARTHTQRTHGNISSPCNFLTEEEESQPKYKGEPIKNYKQSSDSEFETLKCVYIGNLIDNINKRIRKYDSESQYHIVLEPIWECPQGWAVSCMRGGYNVGLRWGYNGGYNVECEGGNNGYIMWEGDVLKKNWRGGYNMMLKKMGEGILLSSDNHLTDILT